MVEVRNNYVGSKSIDIVIDNNIILTLNNDQYDELISELNPSLAEKVKESDLYFKGAQKKIQECNNFIREVRDIFYDMLDFTGVKRDLKNVDTIKLDEILEKYNELLGFE
ncbi:hypothetical protein HZR00_00875 [Elizabethkingia anophelis]|nr:hypothetical protein [Elizabethkingia anophelis]